MKVLFVSSGKKGDTGYIVKNQGESLKKAGVEIDYFIIKGSGYGGYLRNVFKIRQAYKKKKYNLVHAHYSFSAFSASLAGTFPLVVSLMGSDAYKSAFWRQIIHFFYFFRWKITIVKTQRMKDLLKIKKAVIIPNGVDIERFKPESQYSARKKTGINQEKKIIVFVADPSRHEKNFSLAMESYKRLNREDVELIPVYGVSNESIPAYMNAADVLLLTSKWEGGVNVIKEAMACNLPIVSVDVGDVKQNIADVKNCYLCRHEATELANYINLVLSSGERSNGREKIIELQLDSDSVANKIVELYKSIR